MSTFFIIFIIKNTNMTFDRGRDHGKYSLALPMCFKILIFYASNSFVMLPSYFLTLLLFLLIFNLKCRHLNDAMHCLWVPGDLLPHMVDDFMNICVGKCFHCDANLLARDWNCFSASFCRFHHEPRCTFCNATQSNQLLWSWNLVVLSIWC